MFSSSHLFLSLETQTWYLSLQFFFLLCSFLIDYLQNKSIHNNNNPNYTTNSMINLVWLFVTVFADNEYNVTDVSSSSHGDEMRMEDVFCTLKSDDFRFTYIYYSSCNFSPLLFWTCDLANWVHFLRMRI